MKTVAASVRLIRWNKDVPPEGPAVRHGLLLERLTVLEWTDPPGTIYPVHTHSFAQVRVVLHGRMRIGLPESGEEIIIGPGDRLDLPPETPHWEEVEGGGSATYLAGTCEGVDTSDLATSPRTTRRGR